ncbi:MAG: KH domain-containing protein [Erysipelotrichaceae bacterium]|jgi:spoIIIJ-associated protein|nr:KH domain-containing protein [Erysipelotrichaceae bacterium]
MKRYSGKTLEDCLAQATKDTGLEAEALRYTKTEEKTGFLGMGTLVTIEVTGPEDVMSFVQDYLETYFRNIEVEVNVMVKQEAEGFSVMLDAENNAILIGKAGQTLQAINTVVRGAVNSHFKGKFNVLVDINNYKQDRYEKVKALADRVARSVLRSKTTATLDPLPNDERKVIHQYLSEMPHIKTESIGEGNQRRLKIVYDKNKN